MRGYTPNIFFPLNKRSFKYHQTKQKNINEPRPINKSEEKFLLWLVDHFKTSVFLFCLN